MSAARKASCTWTAIICAVACGGSQQGAPESPGSRGATQENGDRSGGSGHGARPEETTAAAHCEDGTCAVCGDGICPTGYYCDETGEPACGWLPRCQAKPSCDCITERLGDTCVCEERDGGLFVRCN